MKRAPVIPAIGGGREDTPEKLWRVMLFNALTQSEIDNAMAMRDAEPDREAVLSDDAAALVQQPNPRAFLGANQWIEELHPRAEHGRFGTKDGDVTKSGNALDARAWGKRADKITELGNRNWGHAEGGWGVNDVSYKEWEQAKADSLETVGGDVVAAVEEWSAGWGVEQWRDAYANYRETGTTSYPGADIEAAAMNNGTERAFEMIDNHRIDDELHRGTIMQGENLATLADLQVGDVIPDGLASWSRDSEVADVFRENSAYVGGAKARVDMTLAPGAHGLDVAALGQEGYAWQEEVIVGGPLVVTSIESSKGDSYPEDTVPTYKLGLKATT